MADKELKRMSRRELLEVMLRQSREIDRQRAHIAELEDRLEHYRLTNEETGSMAEAAMELSGIFEAAQRAADMYIRGIRSRYADE